MNYPILEINLSEIYNNILCIKKLCQRNNIEITGVTKGLNSFEEIANIFVKAGIKSLASSRLSEIKNIKLNFKNINTMLIRIPMISEIKDLVKYCDISLNSELKTIQEINKLSKKNNSKHKIILMHDLGDLREGFFSDEDIIETAIFIEKNLTNVSLHGIGTNLNCYGSIIPTKKNLTKLISIGKKIESKIQRSLNLFSGGATTSLPLLVSNKMPNEINHLRIGEAILLGRDLPDYWNVFIKNLSSATMKLIGEIVEIKEKPSVPIGEFFIDAFGEKKDFKDFGIQKRAILAIGKKDFYHHKYLIPISNEIEILGSSSDHLIISIDKMKKKLNIGDTLEFELYYPAMLSAAISDDVKKIFIKKDLI